MAFQVSAWAIALLDLARQTGSLEDRKSMRIITV
jgi:hypothetical protein